MLRLLAPCLCSLVWATAVAAAPAPEIGPGDLARLQKGQMLFELSPDRGGFVTAWAAEDVAAPPDAVWKILTDCAEALRYVPGLKSCDLVDADPAGRWVVRRNKLSILPFLPGLDATFRLDYDPPRRVRSRQIAGDMSGSEGEWRLEPLDGGRRTRVLYDAKLRLPDGVPAPLARAVIGIDAPAAMRGLRRLSEAQAKAGGRRKEAIPAGAGRARRAGRPGPRSPADG